MADRNERKAPLEKGDSAKPDAPKGKLMERCPSCGSHISYALADHLRDACADYLYDRVMGALAGLPARIWDDDQKAAVVSAIDTIARMKPRPIEDRFPKPEDTFKW
jgi:hypothetical protein